MPQELDPPPEPRPTRQKLEATGRSRPGAVTGKLRTALDAMIWQGASRSEAARRAALSDHSVRQALKRPHVRAHYLAELEVLRTSERARNVHALAAVRDDSDNAMARVAAVKTLEQLADDAGGRSAATTATPGLVVVINTGPADAPMARLVRSDDAT